MRQRILIAQSLLLGCLAATTLAAQNGDDHLQSCADRFAREFAQEVRALLFSATAIDPDSGRDNTDTRKRTLRRQRELAAWLSAKGATVSPADCTTETDRANYCAYPGAMANRELLKLSRQDRKRYIRTTADYLMTLERDLGSTLVLLLAGPGPSSQPCTSSPICSLPSVMPVSQHLAGRLGTPLRVEARFLGRDEKSAVCALYVPDVRTIFIDLNEAASAPEALADSLEHELWHHLLPPLRTGAVRELLREGFTETIAETWGSELHQRTRHPERWDTASVEYPVLTALASLFWAAAPQLVLEYLVGRWTSEELAARLVERAVTHGQTGDLIVLKRALREALATGVLELVRVPDTNRRRVEAMLTDWGWKEDDRSPISIGYLLEDGGFDAAVLERERRDNGLFVRDLIQAFSVCCLQRVSDTVPPNQIRACCDLPGQLSGNLRRVLRYIKNPRVQLANQ